ncbi:uncharacterized protein [Antedon mediterranea]|uniref:uncharacterized protein n=1 Tax=Antedon mediterranea TaxID=105859 RepID=UPI003AF5E668
MWVTCLQILLYSTTIIVAVPVIEKGVFKRSCISNCINNGKIFSQCQDECSFIGEMPKRGCFDKCTALRRTTSYCKNHCPYNNGKRSYDSDLLTDRSIEKRLALGRTQYFPDWQQPLVNRQISADIENTKREYETANDVSESAYAIGHATGQKSAQDRNINGNQFDQQDEAVVREILDILQGNS